MTFDRAALIVWCFLLTGHSKLYYEKMTVDELKNVYDQIMEDILNQVNQTNC